MEKNGRKMSEVRTAILCMNCCRRIVVCTCGAHSEKAKLKVRILELEGDVRLRREEWKKESKENDRLRLKIIELRTIKKEQING